MCPPRIVASHHARFAVERLDRRGPHRLELIEELLKILDQLESPEDILAQPKPRLVSVAVQADEIVDVLKQVYADRIGASSSTRSGGGMSGGMPPFMAMMRGMSGGPRAGGQASSVSRSTDETQKMSLGVDARTNSVIVSAPEPLFTEVKELIEQLDIAAVDSNETMRVVTLQKASLTAVEDALSSLMGDSVQVTRTAGGAAQSWNARQGSGQSWAGGNRRTTRQQPSQRSSGSRTGRGSSQGYRPSR